MYATCNIYLPEFCTYGFSSFKSEEDNKVLHYKIGNTEWKIIFILS